MRNQVNSISAKQPQLHPRNLNTDAKHIVDRLDRSILCTPMKGFPNPGGLAEDVLVGPEAWCSCPI